MMASVYGFSEIFSCFNEVSSLSIALKDPFLFLVYNLGHIPYFSGSLPIQSHSHSEHGPFSISFFKTDTPTKGVKSYEEIVPNIHPHYFMFPCPGRRTSAGRSILRDPGFDRVLH